MKILLIESDEIWGAIAQSEIERICTDARIDWVRTSFDALRQVAASLDDNYEFILLDQNIVGDTGVTVARCIRAMQTRKPSKILMLTSDLSDDTRADALASNIDGFLAKPIKRSRLEACLGGRKIYWELADLPSNLNIYRERHRALAG